MRNTRTGAHSVPDDWRRRQLLACFADDLREAGGGPAYCTPLAWPWHGHIPGMMWIEWDDVFLHFGVNPHAVTVADVREVDRIEEPNALEVLSHLERQRRDAKEQAPR